MLGRKGAVKSTGLGRKELVYEQHVPAFLQRAMSKHRDRNARDEPTAIDRPDFDDELPVIVAEEELKAQWEAQEKEKVKEEEDSVPPSERDSAHPSERDSAHPPERDSAHPPERDSAHPPEQDSLPSKQDVQELLAIKQQVMENSKFLTSEDTTHVFQQPTAKRKHQHVETQKKRQKLSHSTLQPRESATIDKVETQKKQNLNNNKRHAQAPSNKAMLSFSLDEEES